MTRRSRQVFEIPISPNLEFELKLWKLGYPLVAGLDEAGRGAWAGPVYAAAVILPVGEEILQLLAGVRDSKQMSAKQRTFWADLIKSNVKTYGIGSADHHEIDQLGIIAATRLAMQRALSALVQPPQHLLIDALLIPDETTPQKSLIKGDQRSMSIAAASVLAKTARDAFMIQQDQILPGFGFARHKGYGTRLHQQAIKDKGPCSIHRMSFKPLHEYQVG
jgi:ribonuclease HII